MCVYILILFFILFRNVTPEHLAEILNQLKHFSLEAKPKRDPSGRRFSTMFASLSSHCMAHFMTLD